MVNQGFVGFFDILGYQDIIDNNDIENASKIISDILETLPTRTASDVLLLGRKEIKTGLKLQIDVIQARLISDSILLAMPVSEDSSDIEKRSAAVVFLFYVAKLMRLAFDNGLPLRGAVDLGEFFLSSQCFAGKPIIDCYRLASRLQLVGCAITPKCAAHIKEFAEKPSRTGTSAVFMFPCLVMLKGGTTEKYMMLDWYLPFNNWAPIEPDVRSSIIKSFHAHNKDISPEAMQKIDNTEIIIRKSLIPRD
jgi:hypothetical protein